VRLVAVALVALAVATASADPKPPQPELDAIVALRDGGYTSQALARSERAMAEYPDDGNFKLVRASVLANANRFEEARVVIELAIELVERDPDWLVHYGQILNALGDDIAAHAVFERALARAPDHANARAELAWTAHIAAIRLPGGQPPGSSIPAHAVDEFVRAVGGEHPGIAIADLIDPDVFSHFEEKFGTGDSPPSLREFITTEADKAIVAKRSELGEIIGYRIIDATPVGDSTEVRVELASARVLHADDVSRIKWEIGSSSAASVFGERYGAIYDRLEPSDRERYVAEFRGRKQITVEETTFEVRLRSSRWVISDVRLAEPDAFGQRSMLSILDRKLAMSAELGNAMESAIERHAPRRTWHWLDLSTLLATMGVLLWLAYQLVAHARGTPRAP